MDNDKVYSEMDRVHAELLRDVTGSKIIFKEKGDVVSMCLAEEEMIKDAQEEIFKRINLLTGKLIDDNRIDDLKRASIDRDYQNQLLEEYGITE